MNGASEQPHSRYPHVYAIVRWDAGLGSPEQSIRTAKVLRSKEEADTEVRRLNSMNADESCHYFAQVTRLVDSSS